LTSEKHKVYTENMKTRRALKGQLAAIEAETGINRNYLRDIFSGRKEPGGKLAIRIVEAKASKGRWTVSDLRPDLFKSVAA
jgi:hypothetical protein